MCKDYPTSASGTLGDPRPRVWSAGCRLAAGGRVWREPVHPCAVSAGPGAGATRVIDPVEVDVAQAGLDVDAFIDATGSPRAVVSGIKAVRPAGTAVLVGLGASEMTLPVEHIQDLEITVTGIFRYTDTWPAAIHLVARGQVDRDSLVTGRYDLAHAAEALESDQDPDSLKSVVYPQQVGG